MRILSYTVLLAGFSTILKPVSSLIHHYYYSSLPLHEIVASFVFPIIFIPLSIAMFRIYKSISESDLS